MDISETGWIAITAIATIVLAIATIGLAVGVPWSLRLARLDARNRFYAELDRMYLEIQKLIIATPHLSDPRLVKTAEEAIQYDAFAYLTWNFLESIYDYSRQDAGLLETWECVLTYESQLHREWLDKAENRIKFKTAFMEFVVDRKGKCGPVSITSPSTSFGA